MAKCEQGYLCEVCGKDVEEMTDSDLYLRYILGLVDPETLHTQPERHIACNSGLAQFIVDPAFPPILAAGDFDKRQLDAAFVAERERQVTRAWQRLMEIAANRDVAIKDYPLPEARVRWSK